MIGKELIAQKPVSLVKVKEMLKERNKEGELNYEQKTTYDYARKFAKLSEAKAKKLLGELKQLPSIEEAFAIKLLDVLPEEMDVLKVLAHKQSKASEEDLQKALEIIKKYIKK